MEGSQNRVAESNYQSLIVGLFDGSMADYGDYDSNEEEEDYTDHSMNNSITEVDRVVAAAAVSNAVGRVPPESGKKQQTEGNELENPNDLKALIERIKMLENANKSKVLNEFGGMISQGIQEGFSRVEKSKRSRSPEGAPDNPKLITVNITGTDDNHRNFCWDLRRLYKQPNCEPARYWEAAKYPLIATPNLRGNLYLTHLVPLSISSKALGWLHNAKEMIEVKYFTHGNRTQKRAKKDALTIQAGLDSLGSTNYKVEELWEEASSMKEVMDGLLNIMAATFMIRPWDYSPMVILRVIHESSYFSGCTDSKEQQRRAMETFINEALIKTRTNLGQGSPPITYQTGLELAQKVVGDVSGRATEIFRKKCIYSARADYIKVETENGQLKKKIASLQAEILMLKKKGQPQIGGAPSGYDRGRIRGRGGRGRGRGGMNGYDQDFVQDRSTLCKGFNEGRCDDAGKCGLIHGCNRRVAQGVACKHPHRASDHQ